MLDYCAMAFRETGVSGFVELTGPMSPEERAAAILKFSSDKTTKLILLSSAGNVVSFVTKFAYSSEFISLGLALYFSVLYYLRSETSEEYCLLKVVA